MTKKDNKENYIPKSEAQKSDKQILITKFIQIEHFYHVNYLNQNIYKKLHV